MFTPAVTFLMIANTMAASVAIFAASPILSFDVGRERHLNEAKHSEGGAEQAEHVEEHELRKAA